MTKDKPLDPRIWIRDIPDFPKPGIVFKDITPLLGHPGAFATVIDRWPHPSPVVRSTRSPRPRHGGSSSAHPCACTQGRVRTDPQAGQAPLRHGRHRVPA